jgi:uncharacterized protein YoxC
MENNELQLVIKELAEAVLTTTETVDRLATRIDALVTQVETNSQLIQQQGYQILVVGESVQDLAQMHQETIEPLLEITASIKKIVSVIELPDNS